MSKPLSALLAGIALIGLVPITEANAVTINLGSAGLAGGAKFIADEGKIKFAQNVSGETAVSTPGTQYTISVTGQTNQSSSFAQFLIDADGPGPYTITLPTFTDLGTSDFLRLVNGGTGNSEVQISALRITPAAVPGR